MVESVMIFLYCRQLSLGWRRMRKGHYVEAFFKHIALYETQIYIFQEFYRRLPTVHRKLNKFITCFDLRILQLNYITDLVNFVSLIFIGFFFMKSWCINQRKMNLICFWRMYMCIYIYLYIHERWHESVLYT